MFAKVYAQNNSLFFEEDLNLYDLVEKIPKS